MGDALSASAILGYLPNLTYGVPYAGEVDFTRPVAALIVFSLLTAFFWLLRMVVLVRAKALFAKTKTTVDDVFIDAIRSVRPWVYTVVSLYVALQFFNFPDTAELVIKGVFLFAVVWQVVEIASTFVDFFASRFLEKDEDGDGQVDPNAATASNMITLIARIVLWALGALFVLSNLGIEVTSLIAGLGIGGIAVAFALQGVLSDLFASFSIYFDKPFRIGDFIVVGDDAGTVERIGIKSTRIRTLQGQELVISNAELTGARVNNFKRMDERRIVFTVGVTYETPYEKLKLIPELISSIFDGIDGARLDRAHLASFGDFSLNYEAVYFVESADYAEFMDIQQSFNLSLVKEFEANGIEFAYPTQLVYTKQS